MDEVKSRPYDSPIRREQAEATRLRIIEAAAELFEADGYARTTVKAIAAKAGVSPDTIYAAFGSKGRVLTALIDLRLTGSPTMASVLDRPEVAAIRDGTDQREQIALYVAGMVATFERVCPAYEIMRSAAVVDEEMAAIFTEMQGYRARNARQIAGWIAANGPLRLPADEAGDVMFALASPELNIMLRSQRGWTPAQHAAWLEDALVRTLLPDA